MVRPALVFATVAVLLCCATAEGGRVRREVVAKDAKSKFAECVQEDKTERAVVNCLSEVLGERINKEGKLFGPIDAGLPSPVQPGLGGKIQRWIDAKAEAAKDAVRVWAHDPSLFKP